MRSLTTSISLEKTELASWKRRKLDSKLAISVRFFFFISSTESSLLEKRRRDI